MNNSPLNPLRAGLIIMLLMLVAGIFFFRYLPSRYDLSAANTAIQAGKGEVMTVEALNKMMANPSKKILIIDMSGAGGKLSTKNVVQMNSADLVTKRSIKKLKRYEKVVILSNDVTLSHQTALLLQMVGVGAVSVDAPLLAIVAADAGGKAGMTKWPPSEKPRYDYRKVFKALEMEEEPPVIEIKVPVPSAGGC